MVPACYPSKISSTTGLREAVVFALSSVTGLVRWTDYIPVKLVASADAALEGRTDAGGFIPMDMLSSNAGLMGWVDYLPVYVDNSATDAWAITATGFIPYAASGGGISIPSFYLNLSNASNATILDAQGAGTITSVSGGVINAGMSVSRLSGVAPLYVNFDYNGTTSSASSTPEAAPHECFFATDFGDSGAGVWANGVQSSGLTSKNAGYGPVTGHVYETPGPYSVTMVVTDGVNTSSRTATITVQDPNVVYAGALTICISHSGNFTGKPTGALEVNTAGNTDMYAAWTDIAVKTGKRILFCKADSWVSSAQMSLSGLTGTTVGGYGTGVAHTFASGTLVSVTPAIGATGLFECGGSVDCRVMEMRVSCEATHVAFYVASTDSVALTLYKNEVRGATCAISVGTGASHANFFKNDQCCTYECLNDQVYGYAGLVADTPRVTGATVSASGVFTATGHKFTRFNKVQLFGTAPTGFSLGLYYYVSATNLTANTFSLSPTLSTDAPITTSGTGTCDVTAQGLGGGQGMFIGMTRGGIMGCYMDNCNHGEQALRVPYANTAHINNNYIARPNQGKNVFKIHCRGYDDIYPETSGYSEKIVVTANVMDLRGGYSYGEVIPNNGRVATGVGTSDIVIGNGGPSPGGERVRNAIIQHNFTYACLGYTKDSYGFVAVGCPNVTVRNNIADFSIGNRTTATPGNYPYTGMYFISVGSSTTQERTAGIRIYNNTSYSNLSDSETADFCYIQLPSVAYMDVDDVQIKNNIWHYPHAITTSKAAYRLSALAAPTNVSATNNTDSVSGGSANNSPNFVATPPVALTDWRPNTGSYAINSGATVPVLRDFNNVTRVGATYDLGAVLP